MGISFNSKQEFLEYQEQEFLNIFNQYDWKEHSKFLNLVKLGIIFYDAEANERVLGTSKMGGQPDLPENFIWPELNGEPMVFFGQINLEELSEFHEELLMPKNGILFFFSYFKKPENRYGSEFDFIRPKAFSKVLFYDGSISNLKNRKFPNNYSELFQANEIVLDFQTIYQLPQTSETIFIEKLNLDKRDFETFEKYIDDNNVIGGFDQILGYPSPRQYGVDFDLACAFYEKFDVLSELEKNEISQIQPKMVNLICFDLFEKIGGARVFWGIHEDDLKNKKFENAVMIMQDT